VCTVSFICFFGILQLMMNHIQPIRLVLDAVQSGKCRVVQLCEKIVQSWLRMSDSLHPSLSFRASMNQLMKIAPDMV